MMINSVNDQGIEGSSSCDGCDCPQIIRLNPDKDSNTTVVTSPRNFGSWWWLVMILMMISYYDLDGEVCANVLLCFAASRISTQRTRTASGSSMWEQETCCTNINFIWSFEDNTQISASKFQNSSQSPLKIRGVWKNSGVWLKHLLIIWKLTQNFENSFKFLVSWC